MVETEFADYRPLMFQLRLAQTREYHPRDFEHWLHTAQKSKKEMWIAFKNDSQKTQISSSENLEETFAGSRSVKNLARSKPQVISPANSKALSFP